MLINFSDKDILRSKIVRPGWYRVRIDSVNTGISKKGDSTNYRLDGTILRSAEAGDTNPDEFAGVPTPFWNFNSKFLSPMVAFFAAFGVDVEQTKRADIDAVVSRELEIFIGNGLGEDGRMQNKITDQYRPAQG
jgi:hypothetical protein